MNKVIIKVPFYVELEGEGLSQKDLIKGFHQKEECLWKTLREEYPHLTFRTGKSNVEVTIGLIFGISNLKNRITK